MRKHMSARECVGPGACTEAGHTLQPWALTRVTTARGPMGSRTALPCAAPHSLGDTLCPGHLGTPETPYSSRPRATPSTDRRGHWGTNQHPPSRGWFVQTENAKGRSHVQEAGLLLPAPSPVPPAGSLHSGLTMPSSPPPRRTLKASLVHPLMCCPCGLTHP